MADSLISTVQSEIFNGNNVRTGYLKKEGSIVYNMTRQDVLKIPAGATDQALSLIDTTIEYLFLNSTAPITIKINGSVDAMTMNGQFVLAGSAITSVAVSNAGTADVKLDVVQGDEQVSS